MASETIDPLDVPGVPPEPEASVPDGAKLRYESVLRDWEDARKTARAALEAEQKAVNDANREHDTAARAGEVARAEAVRGSEHEIAKAELDADIALEKLEIDLDAELLKSFHVTLSEVTVGVLERSRQAAEYVQTIATAIAALYTGILAFVAVGANEMLPARGLIPVVFLGAAMALAAGYRGFLGKPSVVTAKFEQPTRRAAQMARARFLGDWLNEVILARGAFLRGAVLSLGLGAAFLPIGVIEAQGIDVLAWRWAAVAGFGLAVVLLWQFLTERIAMPISPKVQQVVIGVEVAIALLLTVAFWDQLSRGIARLATV